MTFFEQLFLDAYNELIAYGRKPTAEECRERMIKTNDAGNPISYSLLYGYAKKHSLEFHKKERPSRKEFIPKVLEFYHRYTAEHGKPPTGKMIATALNISQVYAIQLLNGGGITKKKCSVQMIDSEYKKYVDEHGQPPSVLQFAKYIGISVQTVNGFLLKYDLKKKYLFGKSKKESQKKAESEHRKNLIRLKYDEFTRTNGRPPSESELSSECGYTHSKIKYSILQMGLQCSDGHKFRREFPAERVRSDVNSQFWENAELVFSRSAHPSPHGAVKTKKGYIVKQVGNHSLRMDEDQYKKNFMTLKERMENYELRTSGISKNSPQQG